MSGVNDRLLISRKELAAKLDMAESTVDEMVKRGVLPKPIRLSEGCVRWICEEVVCAVASLRDAQRAPGSPESTDGDPYMRGARNVTKVSEGRRGTPEERA